jgi:hypothetical protein
MVLRKLGEQQWTGCVFGSGQVPLAGFREHGNERLCSIKGGEYLY